MKLVPYGDFFLEACNIYNGKHDKCAESWGNLQKIPHERKKIFYKNSLYTKNNA